MKTGDKQLDRLKRIVGDTSLVHSRVQLSHCWVRSSYNAELVSWASIALAFSAAHGGACPCDYCQTPIVPLKSDATPEERAEWYRNFMPPENILQHSRFAFMLPRQVAKPINATGEAVVPIAVVDDAAKRQMKAIRNAWTVIPENASVHAALLAPWTPSPHSPVQQAAATLLSSAGPGFSASAGYSAPIIDPIQASVLELLQLQIGVVRGYFHTSRLMRSVGNQELAERAEHMAKECSDTKWIKQWKRP
jgi:hypothetical protein